MAASRRPTSESVPILVMPGGYARHLAWVERNYNSSVQMRGITKSAEPVTVGQGSVRDHAPRLHAAALRARRAGAGRGAERRVERGDRRRRSTSPSRALRIGPRSGRDPRGREDAARRQAPGALRRPGRALGGGLGRTEAACRAARHSGLTSLQGKSAFPETHPLSLGSGGLAIPAPVHHFLKEADLILGIGCWFTQTNFGVTMPAGKTIIHATLDPTDVNKDVACALARAGRRQADARRR